MEDFMASKNQNGKMPNEHLHELFVDELRDIMGAERQLLKGLKKMTNATKSESLKTAFETHYAETEEHINRLKQVMESLGLAARGKKCKAMEGLLAEADEIIESFEGDEAIDAALLAAAQKVEHYEIASYGCLVTYPQLMGHTDAKEIDRKSTRLNSVTNAHLVSRLRLEQ